MKQHLYLSTSTNGSRELEVLLDSGADISAAGAEMLQYLNEHVGSLYPSTVTPKAVNGTKLHPLGKFPVKLHLGSCDFEGDLHIYPNISGPLLYWKVCKGLGILPDHYLYPIRV